MKKREMNLQLFADLEEIFEQHKDAIENGDEIKESFGKISGKLNELGFDVLINNKKEAEFIPSSRLGEVAKQRDQFKTQVTDLNTQLQAMKDASAGNEDLQAQIKSMMDKNDSLLEEIESTKIDTEIMLNAKDAVDPKDVLVFVNKEAIRVDSKGKILGVEKEIERLREEKPYLFKVSQANRGGSDTSSGQSNSDKFSMNTLIRGAAGLK